MSVDQFTCEALICNFSIRARRTTATDGHVHSPRSRGPLTVVRCPWRMFANPQAVRVEPRTLLASARHDARASARVLCRCPARAGSCESTCPPCVAGPQRLRPIAPATSEAGQAPSLTLDCRARPDVLTSHLMRTVVDSRTIGRGSARERWRQTSRAARLNGAQPCARGDVHDVPRNGSHTYGAASPRARVGIRGWLGTGSYAPCKRRANAVQTVCKRNRFNGSATLTRWHHDGRTT
jgi:hypothetical protein